MNIRHPMGLCHPLQMFSERRVRERTIADVSGEVGGWGRDPKKCTGRDWGMVSSTIS